MRNIVIKNLSPRRINIKIRLNAKQETWFITIKEKNRKNGGDNK